MTSGGWIFSILGLIIILALVGAAIVWATRAFGDREDHASTPGTTAREILDRRLARGEIQAGQYEQLRQTLGVPPEPPVEPTVTADTHVHV